MPEAEKIYAELRNFISRYGLKEQKILVGFSGGADSTSLLLGLQAVHCGKLQAVHFNHGLRGAEADRDEKWCVDFCAKRQIPLEVIQLRVLEKLRSGESVEAGARRCRLEAWQELSHGRPIFLAHHGDDVQEELFLRLARGSNVTGLLGLIPRRQLSGQIFYRPLLVFSKSELLKFLMEQGVSDWCEDGSNRVTVYRRNAVRRQLLPLWQEIFGNNLGLRRSLEALRDDAECLEQMAEQAYAELKREAASADSGDSWGAVESWLRLPRALRVRVLRRFCENIIPGYIPNAALIRDFTELLEGGNHSGDLPLNPEFTLTLRDGRLRVRDLTKIGEVPAVVPVSWQWNKEPELGWAKNFILHARILNNGEEAPAGAELFNLAEMPETLKVRTWAVGDEIQPFGAKFHQKLQDVFVNARIPREQRFQRPVVCVQTVDGDDIIIWLPGVRRAEFGRVSEGASALALWYEMI